MISLEQEIAASGAIAALDSKLNLARGWVWAGKVLTAGAVPGGQGYGEPNVILANLDVLQKAIDEGLPKYLDRAINGEVTWEQWVVAAKGYGSDIDYQVGATGIAAELAALSQVPGDVVTTVKQGVQEVKDAAPFVAAGAAAFAAVVLALVIIWELR